MEFQHGSTNSEFVNVLANTLKLRIALQLQPREESSDRILFPLVIFHMIFALSIPLLFGIYED